MVTRFTANPQRDIATRTDFAGTAIERTTTYGRETNGVINSVSEVAKDIDGTNLPARATLYSGFTDGLYAGTVTNAKGHTATLTYEKRTGTLKSQTRNPMALTTHTYVDALGRTMTQKGEDGVVTDTIGFYCTNVPAGIVCPTGAVYGVATKVTHTAAANQLGAPLAIAFYDALQRPIRSVRFSLDGKVINQATEYNSLGQVTRVSEPYTTVGVQADTTAASAWTTYSDYDALGRPNILIGADNGSKTLSYSTDTLGLKVTEDVIVLTPSSSSDTQTTTRTLNALGQVVNVQDALSNTVSYQYDALGNLQTTQVNNNTATTISISHDLAGNKIAITDPDAGAISFAYNGHGELRKQTWQPGTGDAKSITWAYDLLGRHTTRTDTPASGTATSYSWLWDTLYPGELTQREGNGLKEEYRYDSKLRLNKQTITADSVSRGDFTYLYDAFSRPTEEKYPGGFKVKRDYHALGYQVKTSDITTAASPKTLWTLGNNIDGRGNFSQQLWGNGVVTQTTFNQTSGQLKSIRSGRLSANNPISNLNGDIQNLSYTFDTLGNLYSRSTQRTDNNGLPYEEIKEEFGYDKLNRLTQSTTTGGVFGRTQTFAYDTGGLGNLTSRTDTLTGNDANTGNNDVGTLTYGRVNNAGIHAVTSAGGINYGYDKYGNMTTRGSETLTYNVFNKPTRITGGNGTTDFTYGPDDELYKEVSGGITTYRFAGGIYELIVNGNTSQQKSYVDGVILNTRSLNYIMQTANTTQYLHTDHLGSVEATTDSLGKFVNRMSFSVWGERQQSDWQPGAPTESFTTSKGYTGHRMNNRHDLVDMGGRVYDANLGRFLSADLYVVDPYSATSFNRYSYTSNNPTSRIDPTGYWDQSSSASENLSRKIDEVLVTGNRWNMEAYYNLQAMQNYAERAEYGLRSYVEFAFDQSGIPEGFNATMDVYIQTSNNNYGAVPGILGTAALGVAEKKVKLAEKVVDVAKATKEKLQKALGTKPTETVQRWMSKAELEATEKTGLLRGGRDGTHYVTDSANSDALRARQRSALPQTPDVKVTMTVPQGLFSPPSKVEPAFNMLGGGMERTATGSIPVTIMRVE